MALTVTVRRTLNDKDARLVAATITFDNSYPTGGETLAVADLGLDSAIDAVIPALGGSDVVVYNRATGKLQVFTADGTEATNASDQSTVSRDVLVIGR